jgi:Ca2+-binding EF-hand superfamily protein
MKSACAVAAMIVGAASLALADEKPGATIDPAAAFAEMQQKLLQQFDLNKDGTLSEQEKMMAQEAMRRQGLPFGGALGGADQWAKSFDRNGDGKLSPAELAAAQALWNRLRGNSKGGIRSGGAAGSPPPPPVLPANATKESKKTKVNPLVKRFDKDGDGKLNDAEKAEAQAEFKKDKEGEKRAEKPAKKPAGK